MMEKGKSICRPDRFGEKGERPSNPSRLSIRWFLKAASLAVVGLGMGGTTLLTPQATSAQPQVLEYKFADVQPAQGIYGRYEVKFGKLMSERTGGAVKIAHFGGGSLGGEKDVMEGLRLGSVHISLIGLTLMPFLDVIWGPYVFRDNDHGRKVLDGEIGESWKQRVLKEGGGLRLIDYVYFGPRQLTTKNTPGRTPKELKGLKIRVMEAPIYIATWKALGASPVPMAWPEVFTGLQQGTIDAQENPLELIVSNSLFEVQKYVALTSHVRPYRFLLMNDAAFNKMSKEHQKVFVDTWKEIAKEIEQEYISSDQKYLDLLKSKGMTVVQADVNAYREATKDVWKQFMPKAWGEGVYEKVQAVK
ncbi:MAG TPA: TRAP transporter substrate-binding protein [Thermodesulfobacteriota bacterium]|nr:TRAP transporter substrate-binding protein [Thermodesulfobacteriota bacterium]